MIEDTIGSPEWLSGGYQPVAIRSCQAAQHCGKQRKENIVMLTSTLNLPNGRISRASRRRDNRKRLNK